jgi:hypothetical protein
MVIRDSVLVIEFPNMTLQNFKQTSSESDYYNCIAWAYGRADVCARQLSTGKWTSKLGRDMDIEHDSPEVLNGPAYGEASIFMKKRVYV